MSLFSKLRKLNESSEDLDIQIKPKALVVDGKSYSYKDFVLGKVPEADDNQGFMESKIVYNLVDELYPLGKRGALHPEDVKLIDYCFFDEDPYRFDEYEEGDDFKYPSNFNPDKYADWAGIKVTFDAKDTLTFFGITDGKNVIRLTELKKGEFSNYHTIKDIIPNLKNLKESGSDEDDDEDDISEKKVKVVKGGKVVTKTVKSVKKRLTPAQKQALAKARKKAHTASANKARNKSMKVHNKRLGEGLDMTCPYCGYVGDEQEFIGEDGTRICPECAEVIEGVNESYIISKEEVDFIIESVSTPLYVKQAFRDGRVDIVNRYLSRIL